MAVACPPCQLSGVTTDRFLDSSFSTNDMFVFTHFARNFLCFNSRRNALANGDINNARDFDKITDALTVQHLRIHLRERGYKRFEGQSKAKGTLGPRGAEQRQRHAGPNPPERSSEVPEAPGGHSKVN